MIDVSKNTILRFNLPSWKRLSISFSFTILCVIDVAVRKYFLDPSKRISSSLLQCLAPQFAPTPEFTFVMEEIVRDLYGLEEDIAVVVVGSTAKYVSINVRIHHRMV